MNTSITAKEARSFERIICLSHNDLDGYVAQYLIGTELPHVEYLNGNYGKELDYRINELCELVEWTGIKTLIMVTDLNPSPEQCAKLHDLTVGTNVSLQLLDHHASGQAMADHYDWYYLDSTKSATSIVAEWLGLDRTGDKYIKTLVAATNAADIFLTEDELFPLGRVLADFVFSAKEIPAMVGFKREYLIDTLTYMVEEYFDHGHVELEENLLRMKKEILIEEGSTSVMTLKDVVVKRLGAIIMESHYNYTLMLGGASVCITYDAPYPSDLANRITDNYEQFNLFINISKAGGVSVRSNDHIDSSVVARDLFGGGGHPKASGGFIKNLPEFFSYEDVKKFLVKNYAFTEK